MEFQETEVLKHTKAFSIQRKVRNKRKKVRKNAMHAANTNEAMPLPKCSVKSGVCFRVAFVARRTLHGLRCASQVRRDRSGAITE